MSTPAARIWGPPMPKMETSRRCFRAVARRAAYMSPEASPAERRSGRGGMSGSERLIAGGQSGSFRGAASLDGKRQVLLLVLELIEAVVDAALEEKLLVRALLAQAPLVKDEDAIGVLDGAE